MNETRTDPEIVRAMHAHAREVLTLERCDRTRPDYPARYWTAARSYLLLTLSSLPRIKAVLDLAELEYNAAAKPPRSRAAAFDPTETTTMNEYYIRRAYGAFEIAGRINGQPTGAWAVGLAELREFVRDFRARGMRRRII